MIEERKELTRLLLKVKEHGSYFIDKFNFENGVLSLPVSFSHKESVKLTE